MKEISSIYSTRFKSEAAAAEGSSTQEAKHANGSKIVSLKDIDFGFKNSDNEDGELDEEQSGDSDEDDDDFDIEKLKQAEKEKELEQEILEEENNALEELHNILSKTRNKAVFTKISLPLTALKQEEQHTKQDNDDDHGVDFDQIAVNSDEQMNESALTLDTMSEFCRNLGDIPYGKIGKRNRDKHLNSDDEEENDFDDRKKSKSKKQQSTDKMDTDDDDENDELVEKSQSEDEDMEKVDVPSTDEEEDNAGILEDEPTIDRGLASCLKLAVTKGYLAKEQEKKNARVTKAPIEAINFTIEEKNYYDIDDKYNRNRDRFSGPLTDFDEKSNYKPEIKIDYIDEKGHNMNEKEAFRYLSHKFHGKGSGKKKTEKRYKKLKELESMNKMSSVDTPLNTVALLVEKQKKLQQPFVVLSNSKGKQDQLVWFFNCFIYSNVMIFNFNTLSIAQC